MDAAPRAALNRKPHPLTPEAERSARRDDRADAALPLDDDDDESTRMIPPAAMAAAIAAADAAAQANAQGPAAEDEDGDPDATLVAPGPHPALVALGLVPTPATPFAAAADAEAEADAESTIAPLPASTPAPAPEPEPVRAAEPPAPVAAPAPVEAPAPVVDDTPPATPREAFAATLPGAGATGTPPAIDPGAPVARQVGRYRIVERLGRGGMASVFRANDPTIGRDVALKFLHASLCEDDEYRARFLHEARAAGGLSHPNIVVVHDVGEIDGRPYMAMELLTGQSLAKRMDGGPLPIRQAVGIGIQIARALGYAHAHHIVHRDIKPGNIVLQDGGDTVKVLDFGIAHVDSPNDTEQRTRIGDVLGTPQYMSPEQTAGEKLDGRSDLFSVGIMLYQMLTGQRPFVGDSLVALAWKIAKVEPPPIDKLRPDLPLALRRIVERCLAKAPERRFQTGNELADALQGVLADLDEASRTVDKPRIVPLRVKWAATMALIVAVVMGIATTLITQRQNAAMLEQATSSGASLARFIAAQNAVAALSDDWPGVAVAIQEMMKTGDFQSIAVIDRAGVVRAAADQSLVDQPYKPRAGESLGTKDGGVIGTRYVVGAEPVLGFEAPMTFAGKNVGRVALGLAERPLVRVAKLSLGLMFALVVITVAAVGIAMFFVANWFAQPIKRMSQAMGEIAHGRYDYRIAEKRNDEFGQLYAAFDDMARALEMTHSDPLPPARSVPAPSTGALSSLLDQPAAGGSYPETVVARVPARE